MSKANIKILKQCLNCGNMFEAHKTTTKYCTHKCNSQHYKLRKRLEQKSDIEQTPILNTKFKSVTNQLDLVSIINKEYLTTKEVAFLLNCNTKTIHRLIKQNIIKSTNLGKRLTRIKRIDIESLFK